MGMTGRPGVVHVADVTHGTRTGEQLSGVRPIQVHPRTARGNEPANMPPGDAFYDDLSGQQAYKCFARRVMKA
jgi:hypothetical protein